MPAGLPAVVPLMLTLVITGVVGVLLVVLPPPPGIAAPARPPASSQGHKAKPLSLLAAAAGSSVPRYWSCASWAVGAGGASSAWLGAAGAGALASAGAATAGSGAASGAAWTAASSLPGLSRAEASTSWSSNSSVSCGSVSARRAASGSTICWPEWRVMMMSVPTWRTLLTSEALAATLIECGNAATFSPLTFSCWMGEAMCISVECRNVSVLRTGRRRHYAG